MSDACFNSRMFGSGVVSKKDLFELMMRHKPIDNGDGSKERYAFIEWLGIYHAIRELPSVDIPQGAWIRDRYWSRGVGMGEEYGFFYKCSMCEYEVESGYTRCGFNYCPYCGTDMRGDRR